MFESIEQLQELLKSYYIALRYDNNKAKNLLNIINEIRLEIALDAEVREIFYSQVDSPANASGYQESAWFSKNDINYAIRRGVAYLAANARISAINQGSGQKIITREPLAWQHFFSAAQGFSLGQEIPFDFPQELMFGKNEALGLSITGNTSAGYIFYHGCTFKDILEEVRKEEIEKEISEYLPQPQMIPLLFQFPSAVVGTLAINPSGADEIFSAKYERSVIITHVSTTAPSMRLTLIDEGRNQLICQRVDIRGIAGLSTNQYTTYYKLPYPHLLRRGDRLRMEALNGSAITGAAQAANVLQYINFKGYSL